MDERLQQYDDKMKKAYEFLESDYGTIRAGRANPHVLDKIRVNYYGTPTPIQQVGNVTVPEARIIQIAPWEKSLLRDGNDYFKKLGKAEVSEDEIKQLEDSLQKLTDRYIKDIEALMDVKSKEIMTV